MKRVSTLSLAGLLIGMVLVRYVEAITPNPRYGSLFLKYGKTYQQRGDWGRACSFYAKALNSNPESVDANLALGEALFEREDFEQAQTYLLKALSLNRGLDRAYNDLGIICQQRGALPQAISLFETAARTRSWADSKPAEYRYNLGLAYWEAGDIKAALVEADRVEELENKDLAQRLRNIINSSR